MEEIRALERQKFIHDMIDGKISMQESLEQGRELGIDITATYYSIVLFQAFLKDREDSDVNAYSGVNEEILKRIKEDFADLDNVYLYEQVGDVLCFLEKSDTLEEMGTNINRGIGRITDIMKDFEDWIYFYFLWKISRTNSRCK